MSRLTRDMSMILAGLALGTLLTGGAVAAGIVVQPAWSPIYVDGRQVQMMAYNIAGNNYVKLRDIGKEVGFNVYWQDGVQVDSDAPYTGEAPAQSIAKETVSIASVKGNALKVGDRSGLIVGSGDKTYTVTSSDPAVVSVEYLYNTWVAVAESAGSATITASDGAGGTGRLALTITGSGGNDQISPPNAGIDLNANLEIRQEMIRLINKVRRENGVAELPVNEAIMNAMQDVSSRRFINHCSYEWQALSYYGWLYGGSNNQTCFTNASEDTAAQRAVENWVNSRYHFQTMLCEDATCLGVGITFSGGVAYCHMFVGDPDAMGPL